MALIRRVTDEKDTAMRRADDRLEATERRLSSIYRQAYNEMSENLNAYLLRFRDKDEEYRQRVLDGEMPEDDYIRWRQNNILRTAEMQKQIENLSIGLTRTDELAVAAVRGDMPYIYTDAYNFGGYRGEVLARAAGYNYNTFAVYNTDAVRIIAAEDPDLIPWEDPELNEKKDLRWNRTHIQNAIAQGILQGESIPHIADRLMPIVNMDRNAAVRTARTSYTSVQNQGRRDATARVIAAGIPMTEPWMSVLASNTRDTHLLLHGTLPNKEGKYGAGIIPSGNLLRFPADPLGDPEQVYNCQCRVQSYIEGIDHSHDDELYAAFMQENYYDDWLEVKDYKAADRAAALERQRQLLAGEVENREARIYRNRMQRQGIDVTASEPVRREVPEFTKARTIAEAEQFASQFASSVNYQGIKLETANKINETLNELTNKYPINKLDEIAKKSRGGSASANYQHMLFNPRLMGKALDEETENFNVVQRQAQRTIAEIRNRYPNGRIPSVMQNKINALERKLNFTRWGVLDSYDDHVRGLVTHEYGHVIADQYFGQINTRNRNFASWDYKTITDEWTNIFRRAQENNDVFLISEYGDMNSHEFFAECFAAREFGETIPDYIEDFFRRRIVGNEPLQTM